jgi:hypothetical protein
LYFSLLGLCLILSAKAYAYDNHDFQVWNTEAQELKLDKKSKLTVEEEFRWGDNASELYYQHYDLGYTYLFNKYFNFGGGLRYVKALSGDKFRDETEPYLVTFIYWNPAGFSLSNRTRIEYRYFDYQAVSWRFRDKLDIKFPWKFTKFKIQPMIADEIFFKFNGIDLNENRLYAGFTFNLTKSLRAEICYLLRSTKNAGTCKWIDTNVLSTKLKLAF